MDYEYLLLKFMKEVADAEGESVLARCVLYAELNSNDLFSDQELIALREKLNEVCK